MSSFLGAKVALLHGDKVVTLLRDDKPGLAFANMWDFPGGGRESLETPEETVLRETFEEVALRLSPDRLLFKSSHESTLPGSPRVWFFGAKITIEEVKRLTLGSEGQALQLMPVTTFLAHPDAIPSLQARLRLFLNYLQTA